MCEQVTSPNNQQKFQKVELENNDLRRQVLLSFIKQQIKNNENEWKKERALLLQKLEIQMIQVNECKLREENLKKMNETFLLSLSDSQDKHTTSSQRQLIKDLQKNIEVNQQESLKSQGKNQEFIQRQNTRIRELEESLHEKELQIRDVEKQKDKELMTLQNKLIEFQAKDALNEQKVQKFQAESKYRKDMNQVEHSMQIKELQQQLLVLKEDNKKEIERLRAKYEGELKKAKYQYTVKKSQSIDENGNSYKTPTSRSVQQKQSTELETKYLEEKKKIKSSLAQSEQAVKQLKDKVEFLSKQLKETQQQDSNQIQSLSLNLQRMIEQNQMMNQTLQEKCQLEQQLKCGLVDLTAQLEESKITNERLQQMRLQGTATLGSDSFNKSTDGVNKFGALRDISNYNLNQGERELQDKIHGMISKLHQAKKKITTSSVEESSYIRQSMQKIRSKSRNHSLSMNAENNENILRDLDESKIPNLQINTHYQSFLDDSVDYKKPHINNTTSSFTMSISDETQLGKFKVKQPHSFYQCNCFLNYKTEEQRYAGQTKILQIDNSYQQD